jgi:hypothetical protein
VPNTITPIAELYDPATGNSNPVTGPSNARFDSASALLPGDKVLIAGGHEGAIGPFGVSPGIPQSTAFVYDPQTNKITATGSMAQARSYFQATRLPDGRVVITGGAGTGEPTAIVEIYDPATGMFGDGGMLMIGRFFHTATLLPDNTILIAGGASDTTGVRTQTAEIYDPFARTSRMVSSMFHNRTGHTAVWLPAISQVLIFGGAIDNPYDQVPPAYQGAELYDPAKDTFTPIHTVFQRWGATTTLLPNGTVAVIGGSTNPEGGDDWRMLITEYYHP